jgi:para-nitrobenzyl esterase
VQPGAAHTDDIAFVMGTLDSESDLDRVTSRDRKMSRMMNAYWTHFASKGDPNTPDLPEWPEYEGDYGPLLEFGDEITVRDELFNERVDFHIQRGIDLLEKVRK